jgi:hypothetical protein
MLVMRQVGADSKVRRAGAIAGKQDMIINLPAFYKKNSCFFS